MALKHENVFFILFTNVSQSQFPPADWTHLIRKVLSDGHLTNRPLYFFLLICVFATMKYNEVIVIFVILISHFPFLLFGFVFLLPSQPAFMAQLDVYFAYSKIIYHSASRLIIALQMQQGYLGNAHVDKDVGWLFDYLRICDCMDNFKRLLFFSTCTQPDRKQVDKKTCWERSWFQFGAISPFITTLPLQDF